MRELFLDEGYGAASVASIDRQTTTGVPSGIADAAESRAEIQAVGSRSPEAKWDGIALLDVWNVFVSFLAAIHSKSLPRAKPNFKVEGKSNFTVRRKEINMYEGIQRIEKMREVRKE